MWKARRNLGDIEVLRLQNYNAKYRKVGHSEWYNEYSDTPWHQAERVKTVQLVLGMPKKQIFCKI